MSKFNEYRLNIADFEILINETVREKRLTITNVKTFKVIHKTSCTHEVPNEVLIKKAVIIVDEQLNKKKSFIQKLFNL